MEKLAIGIDLGGTNLKGVILNKKGEGRHLTRIPTEASRGGAFVLKNILKLIGELIDKKGSKENILGVGIGTPGFIDKDGTMLGGAENLPGWKGTQVFAPIMQQYGLKATGGNDVTVTALAELRYGAGRGVDNIVCFALGTGIGGGIVTGGRLYKGTHGMAGELGHIVVETNGLPCNCGQKGCVEQYASATGIANLARMFSKEAAAHEQTPFVLKVNSDPMAATSKMVYDFVKQNDPVAVRVHQYACDMMARAVGIMLNALSPDRVILGGGVLMAGQIIIDTVAQYTPRYCWKEICDRCEIVAAELSEDAGVLGSGAMVFDEFGTND